MAVIICDFCAAQKEKKFYCGAACRNKAWRGVAPATIASEDVIADISADKKEIARLNAMLDAALADVARMQSAPLSDAEKIDESKKTKQELQAQIDAIPARREPGPQVKPAYHSDPHYDYERGYDDSAAAIAI